MSTRLKIFLFILHMKYLKLNSYVKKNKLCLDFWPGKNIYRVTEYFFLDCHLQKLHSFEFCHKKNKTKTNI